MAQEDEVEAVLDLVQIVAALQASAVAVPGGELGTDGDCPVIEPLLDEYRGKAVGGKPAAPPDRPP